MGVGQSASGPVWSFATAQGSSQTINPVWPVNGGKTDADTFNMQWTSVSGASQYQVYFGSSASSLPLYATVSAPTVTTPVYTARPGATYYWQVIATVGSSTVTSAVWSFTAFGDSQAPSLVWPANGSITDGTTFSVQWTAVSGATQYGVALGTDLNNLTIYTTVYPPAVTAGIYNLNPGTKYYWYVVALTGSGNHSSAVWSFTTPGGSQTLSPPTLVWPPSGSTSDATSLNVQWSSVTGATQYQVYFGTSPANLSLYPTLHPPPATAPSYN